jgi:hypothetical protein
VSADSVRFDHPSPRFDAAVQVLCLISAAALAFFMVVQIPLILFAGFPVLIAALIIITCAGLLPFFLLPTISAPEVSISGDGIDVRPRFWRGQSILWSDVRAVKKYPLTPSEGSEVTRKLLVGRRKYRPMEGIMLVIPSLPLLYKMHGLLAGEHYTGLIALTNRTHADYEQLVARIPIPVTVESG